MSDWPAYVWIIESFDPETGLREIEQGCGMYQKGNYILDSLGGKSD